MNFIKTIAVWILSIVLSICAPIMWILGYRMSLNFERM